MKSIRRARSPPTRQSTSRCILGSVGSEGISIALLGFKLLSDTLLKWDNGNSWHPINHQNESFISTQLKYLLNAKLHSQTLQLIYFIMKAFSTLSLAMFISTPVSIDARVGQLLTIPPEASFGFSGTAVELFSLQGGETEKEGGHRELLDIAIGKSGYKQYPNKPFLVFKHEGTGKCISFQWRTGDNRIYNDVVLKDCDKGNSDQRWDIDTSGRVRLEAKKHNQHVCLSLSYGKTHIGNTLEVAECGESNDYGKWFFDGPSGGKGKIKGRYSYWKKLSVGISGSKLVLKSWNDAPTWIEINRQFETVVLRNTKPGENKCLQINPSYDGNWDDWSNSYLEYADCNINSARQNWWFDTSNLIRSWLFHDRIIMPEHYTPKHAARLQVGNPRSDKIEFQKWTVKNQQIMSKSNSAYCMSISLTFGPIVENCPRLF